jgi:hypothetical protein
VSLNFPFRWDSNSWSSVGTTIKTGRCKKESVASERSNLGGGGADNVEMGNKVGIVWLSAQRAVF